MSATHSSSVSKPYGVARVCRVWEVARSTYYDWHKRRAQGTPGVRRGPKPLVPDDALGERIRTLHGELEQEHGIRGEGYRKTHARLRSEGVRASRHRVLRIMRENALLSPTRVGRARGPRVHDGRILTDEPNVMWGTDATTTTTLEEGSAWVFAAVDHCTGELVGIHASQSGSRFEALEPVNQGVRERFGRIEPGLAAGLALRHDNGTQYTSRAFQDQIAFLGIQSSPSFVRSPEGNGVAERFFRTLKEQLLWVRSFRTIEELRLALLDFQRTYNASWILARHGYRTPNQVRAAHVAAA
jgi:transposase InsO family protein